MPGGTQFATRVGMPMPKVHVESVATPAPPAAQCGRAFRVFLCRVLPQPWVRSKALQHRSLSTIHHGDTENTEFLGTGFLSDSLPLW